jgi:hypothetical protein
MIEKFLLQSCKEKLVCGDGRTRGKGCGEEAVYMVWGWFNAEKGYVPEYAVCQKCGDDLSRKIQEGELIEVIQRHTK